MKLPRNIKTERMAVKCSIITWQYLVDHPSKDKLDVPGYEHDMWKADCALCDYFDACNISKCGKCVLKDDDLCRYGTPGSAYRKWHWSISPKTRKKYAKIILNALLEYQEKKGWKEVAV